MVRPVPENNLIELLGAGKAYNGRWIFRDVGVRLAKGECVAIFGGNGTGKSTLLRAIVGFGYLDEGEVRFEGRAASSRPDDLLARRRKVGFVQQGLHLWPYRTALENVTEGLRYGLGRTEAAATAEAQHWLDHLQVGAHAKKYPHELSGGEQQRVAIARALALQPEVLLLDEPTSGLDPLTSGEIAEVLMKLKEEGLTLMIVSHQIDLIRRIADRAYFLEGGRVCEQGVAREMLTEPRTPELANFIARVRLGW